MRLMDVDVFKKNLDKEFETATDAFDAVDFALEDTPTIDIDAENMERMAKVTLWLLQRYQEDLFKEFGVEPNDVGSVMKLFDKIYEEQNKKMPLPWYQYGFGKTET